MNNLEKLQAARVAYEDAHVFCDVARASYEAEIEATLAEAEASIEALEWKEKQNDLALSTDEAHRT